MWMEPARITGEQIAKEHPDWFPEYIKGNHISSGFLDFSNPEAVSWVEQQVIHVISDYKLDLFRVDYNTDSAICSISATKADEPNAAHTATSWAFTVCTAG